MVFLCPFLGEKKEAYNDEKRNTVNDLVAAVTYYCFTLFVRKTRFSVNGFCQIFKILIFVHAKKPITFKKREQFSRLTSPRRTSSGYDEKKQKIVHANLQNMKD